MTDIFKVKVRKIGTSLGVLLPQEKLQQAEVGIGDEVEVALLSHQKDFSGFGLAKRFTTPFIRDKKVRNFT